MDKKYEYDIEKIIYWHAKNSYTFELKNGSKNLTATVSDDGTTISTYVVDNDTCKGYNHVGYGILESIIQNENMLKILNRGEDG